MGGTLRVDGAGVAGMTGLLRTAEGDAVWAAAGVESALSDLGGGRFPALARAESALADRLHRRAGAIADHLAGLSGLVARVGEAFALTEAELATAARAAAR